MDGQARNNLKSRFNPLHQPPTLAPHQPHPSHLSKDAFEQRYQQALALMEDQQEAALLQALSILQSLCETMKSLPPKHAVDHKVLENVVINAWKIMNQLKGQRFKHH